MSASFWPALLAFIYVTGLFALAYWADLSRAKGRSPVDNPLVYGLSLAVYCTSWTFYGSVGRASTQGLDFLAIYIGPTLIFLLAPLVLTRLVAYTRTHGVTSVPDLLEALYGKGQALGAIAAFMLVVGITPYIGLQLKAVGHTFDLLTGREVTPGVLGDAAFWAALCFCVFAILFGARTLDATERHEGLVAAVAFESAVKLIAFVVLGAYATWTVGGGLGEISRRALADPELSRLVHLGWGSGSGKTEWLTLCVLSAAAVVLLPRQFHMLAVENVREGHIRRSAWIFPLYLLLINLLVLPVALVGRIAETPGATDFVLINLPLSRGNETLAFLAFLGGFSAATSMVVVSSVAMSNVVLHHLVVPSVLRRWSHRDLGATLLYVKRTAIFAVVLLGYAFYRGIGEPLTLVNTGLISFCAVLQFAPAVFLGLYWKGVTRTGAVTGLAAGFGVWFYTLLLPSFVKAGWLSTILLDQGPWNNPLLRPQALLGFEGVDPWTHTLVWSLLFNLGGCVMVSLMGRSAVEPDEEPSPELAWVERSELESLLSRFVGPSKAAEVFVGLPETTPPRVYMEAAERCLTGAVGTASARMILQGFLSLPSGRAVEILDIFGGVSQGLAESRESLERRVRELSVLHQASTELSTSLDIDTLLKRILRLIQSEFGFDHLGVRLLNARGQLEVRSRIGLDPDYADATNIVPSRETMFGRAFLDQRPVVVGDVVEVPMTNYLSRLQEVVPVTALIHAPMIHERKAIGVLMAYSTHGPVRFTDEFVNLFCALANQMALAVINANLYQEVNAYSHAMEERVRQRTTQLEAANERLLEIDRLKSEFLSNVSHELRTPLTSIQSFSEILTKYGVDDEQKRHKFATIIRDEAHRLTRMINNLLDLSKIEAGRLEIETESLDLGELLERVAAVTAPLFERNRIKVELRIEPGMPSIRAEADRLTQILNNLLGNAAKFSPPGSTVRLRGRRRGAFAVVSVADEGPGINPQEVDQVFDRYTQLRDPNKQQPQGTGLGLAICRDLVEMLGGYIWVESPPGKGATFSFTLPFAGAEENPG